MPNIKITFPFRIRITGLVVTVGGKPPSQPYFGSRALKRIAWGVLKFGYLAMITFTVVGSFWLEIFLKVGVLRRARRVVLSILPVATIFIIWDLYAISRGHWHFDSKQIIGLLTPGGIPFEEILFFTVVPLAAIMTIEAVGVVKRKNPKWIFGDEK